MIELATVAASIKEFLLPSSGKNIIESTADVIDKFVDTKGEKAEREAAAEAAKRELTIMLEEWALERDKMEAEDRMSAREMLKESGGKIQGMLTILFTAGYFGLTAFMISFLLQMLDVEMNDFVVSFVSMVFGAFNAIMVQIISFYFGSSKGGEDTGKAVANSFNLAARRKDSGS